MNTPAHLIFGAAAFGRAGQPRITVAAIAGSLVPDLSLYFMVAWNTWVRGLSEREIFGREYFSDYWQGIFAIDNSLPLWAAGLAVVILAKWRAGIAFFGAGCLHLVLDFLLHHDDGRMHFWPFSRWIFESPVSYWDPSAHGGIIGPLEVGICLALLVVLWRRFRPWWARTLLVIAGCLEVLPTIAFALWFGGP